MKASKIFFGTISFCWLKLALGFADVLLGALLFGVVIGIATLIGSSGVGVVLFFIWLGVWGIAHWLIKHYFSYLIKAGHIAVIAQSLKEGAIPANPVTVGKNMVTERFGTSSVYFLVDKLVAGAVRQLQKVFGKATELLGSLPGGGALRTIGKLFIDISLGYVDECCLGYTFYHPEQNAYKSAADGVVVYTQNWKQMLKDAAKTTFVVLLTIVTVTLLAFVAIGGLFRFMDWNMIVAVILSLFVSFVVKHAFVDSWILVKMMSSYLTVAETTTITFDLYGKLCNLSSKFKKLFQKGGAEPSYYASTTMATQTIAATTANMNDDAATANTNPTTTISDSATANTNAANTATEITQGTHTESDTPLARFCGNCGVRNNNNSKFCTSCGANMSVAT